MEAKVQSPIVSEPVGGEVSPDFAVEKDKLEKVSGTERKETSTGIPEENEVEGDDCIFGESTESTSDSSGILAAVCPDGCDCPFCEKWLGHLL